MDSEAIKLDEFHSSKVEPKQAIAEEVNAFIEDASIPAYEVTVGSGPTGKILVLIFNGAGILSFASYLARRLKRSRA
jgi:hypothetical protein